MPFTYDWSDDLVDQEDQSNLPPGEYTLSVIDLNGCEVDESYTIVEPDTLTVSLFSPIRVFPDFNISEFMGNDGAIEAARIEEERRLMYVGITRAQRSLHLTWCARRRRQREERVCEVSRFVAEMGLEQPKPSEDLGENMTPKARIDMLKSMLSKGPRAR